MSSEPPVDQNERDSRLYGMLCHLLALSGFVCIPFGNIIGPLVVWLVKKDQFPFVDAQGRESLNFQITMTIAAVVLAIVTTTLGFIPIVGGIIAVLSWVVGAALAIYVLVQVIMASMKANQGEPYRYPIKIEFIK